MAEQNDPVLVSLARIEAKLDNALDDIREHKDRLMRHDSAIGSLRDRVTTLEASKPKHVANWVGNAIAGLAAAIAILALLLS